MAEQRTLERRLLFKKNWDHWEEVEFRLKELYKKNKDEWDEYKKEKQRVEEERGYSTGDIIYAALNEILPGKVEVTENPNVGQQYLYINLGKDLLEYEGINDSVASYTELERKMWNLGRDVAFLCQEFNDFGLITEEIIWFGRVHYNEQGQPCVEFANEHPANPPEERERKWPFSDCSELELMHLYTKYQKGKIDFFTKKMEYGNSFKGE